MFDFDKLPKSEVKSLTIKTMIYPFELTDFKLPMLFRQAWIRKWPGMSQIAFFVRKKKECTLQVFVDVNSTILAI